MYWLGALAIFAGYTIIGGSLFGFPKYQMPAFPLLALALGTRPVSFKWHWGYAGIALICLALPILSPDPLYILRVALKQAVFDEHPRWPVIVPIVAEFGGLLLITAGILAWKHLDRRMALLLSALAFNFAFALTQDFAPYATGYIYGEAGECAELAAFIRENDLENRSWVPAEIATLVNEREYVGFAPGNWENLDELAQRLSREQPALIACSLLINPLDQMKAIRSHEALNTELNLNYDMRQMGTMIVWIRKGECRLSD